MKGVIDCDKPREAVNKHYIRGFPNGETQCFTLLATEFIGCKGDTRRTEISK